MHSLSCDCAMLAQCEVCQALEESPRIPAAGASTAAMFNENMAMFIALHAMDVVPTYPLLIAVRAKNPRGAWGVSCSSRIRVLALP